MDDPCPTFTMPAIIAIAVLAVIVVVLVIWIATSGFTETYVAGGSAASGPPADPFPAFCAQAFPDSPANQANCRSVGEQVQAMKARQRAGHDPTPQQVMAIMDNIVSIPPRAFRDAVVRTSGEAGCLPTDRRNVDPMYDAVAATGKRVLGYAEWAKEVANLLPQCNPAFTARYQKIGQDMASKMPFGPGGGSAPAPVTQQPAMAGSQVESQMN